MTMLFGSRSRQVRATSGWTWQGVWMRISATSPTTTGATRLASENAAPALAARRACASGESPLVIARGPSASSSSRSAGAGSPEAERRGALSSEVASRSGVGAVVVDQQRRDALQDRAAAAAEVGDQQRLGVVPGQAAGDGGRP